MTRALTKKLPGYLIRLHISYHKAGKMLQRDIIAGCHYSVTEDVAADRSWNEDSWGHRVDLFLPLEQISEIDIDALADVAEGIREDLNKLSKSIRDEWYNAVAIELANDDDPDFQRATAFSPKPPINPDNLSIWKAGLGRVFISHRDKYKAEARQLADALIDDGFSCFVAHETIPANEEWRKVIVNGLETMETMIVFLTDDFSDSIWTMQEVGYALGKGVPILSLKLGQKDPPGFIGHIQALKGKIDRPIHSAQSLLPLLAKALGSHERVQELLINNFLAAESFNDAKHRFDKMKASVATLSDAHIARFMAAFSSNSQLYDSIYLTNDSKRLQHFLNDATGRQFIVSDRTIIERKALPLALDDDVPF